MRTDDGTLLVLDAGTGIRALGQKLSTEPPLGEIHILLSHLHLDHLVGLGFFAPLFAAGSEVHVWGPASPTQALEDRIGRYLSPPLFPVRLTEVPSRIHLHDAPEEPWRIGSARIRADAISHNGPTLGYRIEADECTIAYLPDHEPALGVDIGRLEPEWLSGYRLGHLADVLIHDAQYTREEYEERVGWGHSSTEHVVLFGQRTGAECLVLFHHDPLHSDDDLEWIEGEARRLWGPVGTPPRLAFEGMVIDVAAVARRWPALSQYISHP